MASAVLSTYRLQMRGDCFTFADAEELLPYLDELGVSHLYLSPILQAASGSKHGYDVIDHTRVADGLGGDAGFARLVAVAPRLALAIGYDLDDDVDDDDTDA